MIESGFQLRIAEWPTDTAAIRRVRQIVFVVEQQVPPDLEWDGLDQASVHVLAESANRDAVGTGRLEPTGKIGRIAVLKAARRHGIGTAIVERLVAEARRVSCAKIYLHAQVNALNFYTRLGFRPEGKQFLEAGILHQTMRLDTEN